MGSNGSTAAVAAAMAEAATTWLGSLHAAQAEQAHWPFPSDEERRRWFYTPPDHGGLTLGAMTPRQQQAALRLLATGLSRAGYVTAATIMGLENVLDLYEGFRGSPRRERNRDPGLYYVRVFGEPGGDAWSWRFGGHHVSVHATLVDGEPVSMTPCFFGADPASSPLLGPHLLRPLGAAEDLARQLVRSLDEGQLADALLAPAAPPDIVGGNRPVLSPGDEPLPIGALFRESFEGDAGSMFDAFQRSLEAGIGWSSEHLPAVRLAAGPVGLPASAMGADQQELLRAVLGTYVERVPEALADQAAATYAGDGLAGFSFAWAGGREPGEPHYYRIEGGDTVVEYDNTQNDVNHVHAVWRERGNDFGAGTLAEHHRSHH